jgi:hypothetical protein
MPNNNNFKMLKNYLMIKEEKLQLIKKLSIKLIIKIKILIIKSNTYRNKMINIDHQSMTSKIKYQKLVV